MINSKRRSRAMSIIIAIAMVFSVFAFMPEDVSAAAKKPGKVKITKATKMNQIITVKWKKAKNAKKYQIYLKEGKKKWKKVATVKSNKRSYAIKRLKWSTTYQVKMRAVNGKKKGKWSRPFKGKLAKKTTLEKSMNSKAKAELDALGKELSDNDIDARVSVKGNTMVIGLTYKNEDCTGNLDAARNVIRKEYVNTEMNRLMKKEITRMENTSGIFGITIRIEIYDGVGNSLLNYTYN